MTGKYANGKSLGALVVVDLSALPRDRQMEENRQVGRWTETRPKRFFVWLGSLASLHPSSVRLSRGDRKLTAGRA